VPLGSVKGSAYPYASNRAVVTNRRGIQRGGSLLYHQSWAAPTAKVANGITTATAGPNNTTINLPINGSLTSGGVATLLTGQGPFTGGRNVVVTVTHASSIVAVNGVITGTDVYGVKVTETWSVTATGTSKTYVSKTAFKRITGITAIAVSDASADTITVGDGDILGLDVILPSALGLAGGAIKEVMDATLLTTGVLVAGGISISAAGVISITANADPRGTYAPATIPNGAHNYDIWYISDMPEYSGGA
jgi:hypothetical protein